MTRFWDEQFEGAGYEETWGNGETVSGSSALDEDFDTSSVTGAPADWDDQCLRANMVSSAAAWVGHDFSASEQISYARIELIWGGFPDGMSQFAQHSLFGVEDSSGTVVWRIDIQERGSANDGPYRIHFRENSDGGGLTGHHDAAYVFSLDTRQRIEVKWDGSANEWEFRLNGSTTYSGSIAGGPTDIQQDLRVGLGAYAGSPGNCELFYDNIAFDDTDWIGAEAAAGSAAIIRRRREDY